VAAPILHSQLESQLPAEIAVGAGTALFVCGWCFCAEAAINSLSFLVDGDPQPVAAHGMPRLDPFRALHPGLDPYESEGLELDPASPADPRLRSYRSGFWGLVRLDPKPRDEPYELSLLAELEGGGSVQTRLGAVGHRHAIEPFSADWPAGEHGPPVAIAMATHNPPADLFVRQVETIRAQTHRNWICVVSDDCSEPTRFDALVEAIGGDPRFFVSRSPRRLGFYENFERALELVPAGARYVALSDQDDAWHPDKLQKLLAGIGDARLVYSDARVVNRDGALISDTWWSRRRNNHSDLHSLLVANSVTGAASLFERGLLDYALPFPPAQFAHFHDHWSALTALSLGPIAFVAQALYDYVQHGDASLGHAAANQIVSLRDRLMRRRALQERVRMWRLHYFVDVWRLRQFATVLMMRCGPAMPASKRRTLQRFLDADESPTGLLELGLRGARELVGTPETLGADLGLFNAVAWRRLVALSARQRPQRRLRLDALPPSSLYRQPGRIGLDQSAQAVADKVAPLRWAVSDAAPVRINLLIPTIDLRHLFAGYIGKFNLARRLAERGLRVRIVTVDPVGPLPADWRATVQSYDGLRGLLDQVEIAFGRESPGLEVSREDHFIATTWWTAHIANDAAGGLPFLYLIQEYEPFTFPMGTYAALAGESYELAHFALFSSELLRGYFRRHGIGVYAAGERDGDAASMAFENAITPIDPPSAQRLASRRRRRLLFYARPEPHAARNMFELGLLALSRALADGVFESGWDLHGIGTVERPRGISLGGGATLRLLPRSDQRSYAELLAEHDVGLALMYTPHPSLVPIEMASAGMLAVTNSFENKTPEAMSAISPNLITAAPSVQGVVAGLREAAARVDHYAERVQASRVSWSRSWDDSFPDALLDRVIALALTPGRVRPPDRGA
jgi:glycosyltransferase involved in cell wall biosynthesis